MSRLGQTRHFDRASLTSGLPRLADIPRVSRHFSKVPIAAVPNVHSRKAPATKANAQVLLLKNWTVAGLNFVNA